MSENPGNNQDPNQSTERRVKITQDWGFGATEELGEPIYVEPSERNDGLLFYMQDGKPSVHRVDKGTKFTDEFYQANKLPNLGTPLSQEEAVDRLEQKASSDNLDSGEYELLDSPSAEPQMKLEEVASPEEATLLEETAKRESRKLELSYRGVRPNVVENGAQWLREHVGWPGDAAHGVAKWVSGGTHKSKTRTIDIDEFVEKAEKRTSRFGMWRTKRKAAEILSWMSHVPGMIEGNRAYLPHEAAKYVDVRTEKDEAGNKVARVYIAKEAFNNPDNNPKLALRDEENKSKYFEEYRLHESVTRNKAAGVFKYNKKTGMRIETLADLFNERSEGQAWQFKEEATLPWGPRSTAGKVAQTPLIPLYALGGYMLARPIGSLLSLLLAAGITFGTNLPEMVQKFGNEKAGVEQYAHTGGPADDPDAPNVMDWPEALGHGMVDAAANELYENWGGRQVHLKWNEARFTIGSTIDQSIGENAPDGSLFRYMRENNWLIQQLQRMDPHANTGTAVVVAVDAYDIANDGPTSTDEGIHTLLGQLRSDAIDSIGERGRAHLESEYTRIYNERTQFQENKETARQALNSIGARNNPNAQDMRILRNFLSGDVANSLDGVLNNLAQNNQLINALRAQFIEQAQAQVDQTYEQFLDEEVQLGGITAERRDFQHPLYTGEGRNRTMNQLGQRAFDNIMQRIAIVRVHLIDHSDYEQVIQRAAEFAGQELEAYKRDHPVVLSQNAEGRNVAIMSRIPVSYNPNTAVRPESGDRQTGTYMAERPVPSRSYLLRGEQGMPSAVEIRRGIGELVNARPANQQFEAVFVTHQELRSAFDQVQELLDDGKEIYIVPTEAAKEQAFERMAEIVATAENNTFRELDYRAFLAQNLTGNDSDIQRVARFETTNGIEQAVITAYRPSQTEAGEVRTEFEFARITNYSLSDIYHLSMGGSMILDPTRLELEEDEHVENLMDRIDQSETVYVVPRTKKTEIAEGLRQIVSRYEGITERGPGHEDWENLRTDVQNYLQESGVPTLESRQANGQTQYFYTFDGNENVFVDRGFSPTTPIHAGRSLDRLSRDVVPAWAAYGGVFAATLFAGLGLMALGRRMYGGKK